MVSSNITLSLLKVGDLQIAKEINYSLIMRECLAYCLAGWTMVVELVGRGSGIRALLSANTSSSAGAWSFL